MKKIIVTIIGILCAFTINAQVQFGTNSVTGTYASAVGTNNTASGTESFVGGINSQAAGKYSIAYGNEAIAGQRSGISLGYRSFIYGPYSVGIGENIQTTTTSAMVIGSGVNDDTPLTNGISRSLMIGFNSDIPTLFVGKGLGVGTVGNVGIGTTIPTTLLDVAGTFNVDGVATFGSSLDITGTANFAESVVVGDAIVVNGKTTTNQLQITDGAAAGKILNSDASGNASWVDINTVMPEAIWSENNDNVYLLDMKVGIGTNNPTAQLSLADIYEGGGKNLQIGNDVYLSDIDNANTLGIYGIQDNTMGAVKLGSDGPKLYGKNGNLGIGTIDPTEALSVNGNIICEQIEVVENVPSSDFVFEKDYELMSIQDLESFVTTNHHLPEIPSAAEFKENGYNMNDMDDLLLRKVEQLTLYIIALEKKVDVLENNQK